MSSVWLMLSYCHCCDNLLLCSLCLRRLRSLHEAFGFVKHLTRMGRARWLAEFKEAFARGATKSGTSGLHGGGGGGGVAHVVVDDEQRFVTGQNQNSGLETAHSMMQVLKERD